MNRIYARVRLLCTIIVFSLIAQKSSATHIFGGELYYTNVSGLQYQVTLVLYGDCAGSAFPLLNNATPTITVLNNNTFYQNMTLTQSGLGVEVTPVCPSQAGSTTCTSVSNPVPGVKRYIYSGTITLNATSTNWRFDFDGVVSPASSAGRSTTITNILNPGNSLMGLEATLNNTTAANSSPTYTTVPTPFFCLNKPANYNPGAVDANGDNLTFALVPGIEATTGGTVTYFTGYSATQPLATSPGSFVFNGSTGQLTFTPNLVQTSLVVYRVSEYRNGVLVGTSMREMNFITLNNCNNNPPGGIIASSSGGNVLDTTTVTVCQSQGLFSFNINAGDIDGNNVNLTWAGIPPGAIFTVLGNGTNTPIAVFSWDVTNAAPGTYTMFITYIDDGCPLASKQTVAYTITVLPKPTIAFAITQPATCTKKAVFTVTPGVIPTPWIVKVIQGNTTVINRTNVTGTITDSLSPGTYTFTVLNGNSCQKDTIITIAPPPVITVSAATVNPVCNGASTGSITLTAGGGRAPFQYALGTGAYGSTSVFNTLAAGMYTFHIKDANDCTKDTTITLIDPNPILATVTTTKPPCNHFQNGSLTVVASNSTAPYTYALGTGAYGSSGTFTGLFSGTYTVHIKNSVGCIKDTVIILPDSVKIQGNAAVTNILCNGGNNGSVTITASGAFPPYTYAVGTGAFGSANTFTPLTAGTYTFHVLDTNLCYFDTTLTLLQPLPVTVAATTTNILCHGSSTGTVTLTGGGGTNPYTYANGTGAYGSSGSFTGLAAGTYTFHVKDANNCIKDTTLTLTEPTAITGTITSVIPQCVGSADGSITITGSGGVSPYTYANGTGTYSTTNVFSALTAGTYTLHIKDANNCIKDTVFTLLNPPAIVPAAVLVSPLCNGGNNGTITLTATGGASPYTYANGTGAYGTSGIFTGLTAGSYTLHVKDAHNCIKDTTINLPDASPIHGTVTLTQPPCNHFQNGVISIAGFNGTAPYTYAIGTGTFGTSGTFNGLFSGNYTLHIKDANGCQKDTLVILPDSVKIAGSATVTSILCNGDATGAVTIGASGAFPPYTYALGTGTFGAANGFPNLPAGTYTFHVQDTRLCYFDTTITLSQPTRIVPGITVTNVNCNNGSDGTVTVSATGGTNPYTYANGTGGYSGTTLYSGLPSGSYTFHVKDANNCIKDTTFNITQPTVLNATVVTDTPSCNGSANGAFTITGTGGTSPYTYAIGTGTFSSTNNFPGLAAGTYTLHVKDANNCLKDTTITLTQPTAVGVTASVKNSTCTTLSNGKVTLTASGGTSPYTYANGTGAYGSSNVFTPLAAGSYTFHVKDSKGCIKDTIIAIVDTVFIGGTVTVTNATCFNTGNGSITVTTQSGGLSPYTYAINTGTYSSSNTFSTLLAGSYTVHIKDANGCIHDTTVQLTQPTVIVPTVVLTQPTCNGGTNGAINISAAGGTPGYTYALGTGAYNVANNFTNLAAGTYILHVKDLSNCIHDTSVILGQPAALTFTLALTNNLCFGDNTGTVTVTATGGTSPFTYASDNNAFQASNLLTNLVAGTHAIHLKDNNGCTKDTTITLTQPAPVTMAAVIRTPTCEGFADGIINISGVGGTAPYQYAQGSGTFGGSGSFIGLTEGTYTYHIKDAHGCSHDTTINLVGYPHITYDNLIVKGVSCFGYKDGSITLNMGGGTPPFSYQVVGLSIFPNGNTFEHLKTGNYPIEITDSKGCIKDTTINISTPDKLVLTPQITPNDCQGLDDEGMVKAIVTGGTQPYAYLWNTNPVSTTASIQGMPNGSYIVWVHDANNCTDSAVTVVAYDDCCKPFIPDAFTPNGDGRNDLFRVVFKGDLKLQDFSIFNRYGQRIFYTTDYTQGWDGTFNGKPQDLGVYYYYVKIVCGNKGDHIVEFKGDVTLIR